MSSLSKLRSLPAEFRSALKAFADSSSNFRVVRTVGSACTDGPPEHLYVLDSSFNPPTLGHLDIALSALKADTSPSRHLLLLLATQNADKPTKPAQFEQRMAMMSILAESVVSSLSNSTSSSTTPAANHSSQATATGSPSQNPEITVHVGITKYPYFIDKSHAIGGTDASSSPSSSSSTGTPFRHPPTRQTHLIGFDTFTRLMDPKYYEPDHTLRSLAPLFAHHAVRVTLRTDDGFGSGDDQRRYVGDIALGNRDGDGADRAWADRIHLVPGVNADAESGSGPTSSTRAREAAAARDRHTLVAMCGEEVARWVLDQDLYSDS